MVPGTGLEPASREAANFKSAMFTNFIIPAGRTRFYHCVPLQPNRTLHDRSVRLAHNRREFANARGRAMSKTRHAARGHGATATLHEE
jgi:hypothetical protein